MRNQIAFDMASQYFQHGSAEESSGHGPFNAVVECPGVETDIGVRPADGESVSRQVAFVVASLHSERDNLKNRLRPAKREAGDKQCQGKQLLAHELSHINSPAMKPRDESKAAHKSRRSDTKKSSRARFAETSPYSKPKALAQ
jgi:hypothetical protein